MMDLQINTTRFLHDMREQAEIGATGDGGVDRPALSEADMAIRAWFRQRANQTGLAVRQDGAANISVVLPSDTPGAKTLLMGSHLDSVRHGGRFDGPLGVLSALEALRVIHENEIRLPFHLECVSFTDEEGTHLAELGSGALAGALTPEKLAQPRTGQAAFAEGLQRVGVSIDSILSAKRDADDLLGYVEVHIEQGTRLVEANLSVGIVNAIVGIRAYWLHFEGQAAHAGTMPIRQRKDAFMGAADFTQQARELVLDQYDPGVANVGQVRVGPGSFNIVPATASISLEFRHGDAGTLDAMQADLLALAEQVAAAHGLSVRAEPSVAVEPATMHPAMMDHVRAAADQLGLGHTTLMSFAGHDPQNTAKVTPSVMYFVPSVDGISHNPREFTSDDDCVNAANVMLHTVLQIAASVR
jgi:beta-ureidopropionase / N-carbamoyl-L-amino-acid hydrolase